tara:strand:- start:5507 stop:7810 length:2304 start_codon:yes stop_codon:yes gene_type:complete
MAALRKKEKIKLSQKEKTKKINRFIIFSILTISISLLFPGGEQLDYNYEIGDITREEIVAEFNFPILKSEDQLQKELIEAKVKVPYEFQRNQNISIDQNKKIEIFFNDFKNLSNASNNYQKTLQLLWEKKYGDEENKIKTNAVTDSALFIDLKESFLKKYPFDIDDPQWIKLISQIDQINLDSLALISLNICKNNWAYGIYDIPKNNIISEEISLSVNEISEIINKENFFDLEEAWIQAKKEVNLAFSNDESLKDLMYSIIIEFLKPNLIFDSEKTERNQNKTTAIIPRSKGIIMENERIIDANTRVNEEMYLHLKSYLYAINQKERNETGLSFILPWIGRILIVVSILSLFFSYLKTYRIEIYNKNQNLILFSSLFFLIIALSYIFVLRFNFSEYLIPFTVGAMVITVLFDGKIAINASIILAILVGFVIGGKLDFSIVGLFTSMAAIYSVRQLRTRAQLFIATLFIILSGSIIIIGIGLIKKLQWSIIGDNLINMLISGLLAPLITYGISTFYEVVFRVTSDLTLLELTDFNHPLLKKLSQEANGTFNHCIVVGNLAESCANAIGANPLLARVGAYYHDIGKLSRPEYFVENQYGGDNPHDELSPSLSSKIIIGHVKDGIKLAKEYRLPPAIANFIPMHHGTSKIDFFYNKALEIFENDFSKINEDDFKYPGPKPNTKETGLLMICEAVEAAVRSLKNPTLTKIESMADKIIQKRLQEGQLDNCPLTISDLNKIKGNVKGKYGMMSVFKGIYHLRIEYPNQEQTK